MTHDKLKEIIASKNEQLERNAVQRAREIIDEIADYQDAKVAAEKKIAELRAELKSMEIQQVDATSILGN